MTASLSERAEAAIRRLPDVEGVSVNVVGEDIREVHVLASGDRPAKNLVRNIVTALRAGVGVAIDHRIVSIAQQAAVGATAARPEPVETREAPPAAEPVRDDRIRFESVNLFVSGARTQAQVELRWKGLPRMGSASGWSTRDESHRLVAQATAAAVQDFVAEPVALNVQSVELLPAGKRTVAIVVMTVMAHRQEKVLTGSCTIEQDTPQAVVLATLSALNRLVSGMKIKEPTEYVLRPESYLTES